MDDASISVVIPAFGRPDRLAECLAALASQDGGPYETIVVDDGSPQPLAPVCASAGAWVRCIRQPNAGPAKARNAAVRAASGDFVCFTDDDCRPHAGWARALRAAQDGDAARLVGGRTLNAFPGNAFTKTSQSISDWVRDRQATRAEGAQYFASNNIGCARRTFLDIGGFDESFPLAAAEDREFGMRWRRKVGPLVFGPAAVIDHAHDLDLRRFWRQQANYGRGARHLHRLATHRSAGPGRFEGASFYAGLMLHPMTGSGRLGRRLQETALAVLSQVAITAGYFDEGRRASAGIDDADARG